MLSEGVEAGVELPFLPCQGSTESSRLADGRRGDSLDRHVLGAGVKDSAVEQVRKISRRAARLFFRESQSVSWSWALICS